MSAMGTHTWRVPEMSTQKEELLQSDTFTVGGVSWRILLYPKGYVDAAGSHLGLFLRMVDAADKPYGWICPASVTLVVKSQTSEPNVSMAFSIDYHRLTISFGWAKVR
jgi:hypothetical protein